PADDGAAARVRRDQQADAGAGGGGRKATRRAVEGVGAAGRRSVEDRSQGEGAEPGRDRPPRRGGQTGGQFDGHQVVTSYPPSPRLRRTRRSFSEGGRIRGAR